MHMVKTFTSSTNIVVDLILNTMLILVFQNVNQTSLPLLHVNILIIILDLHGIHFI